MNIEMTGRGFDITSAIRQLVDNKIPPVLDNLPGNHDVRVVLSVEKDRHAAEIIVRMKGKKTVTVTEETDDMYQALQIAIGTLEKSLRKHQDRKIGRRRKKQNRDRFRLEIWAPPEMETPPVEGTSDNIRVVHSKEYNIKPMSVEEAVLEMDDVKNSFLVFRNSESEHYNIVYKRNDGRYGLLELE